MKIKTILPVVALVTTLMSCHHSDTGDQLGDYFRRNDFRGAGRIFAASFNINGVNYVTTGYTGTSNGANGYDVHTYVLDTTNPSTYVNGGGDWEQKADFPGAGRAQAVGFSDGKYGYVGTGLNADIAAYYSDFHIYDPNTDKWDVINGAAFKVADLSTAPGIGADGPRSGACSFTLSNAGYVGTGYSGNNQYLLDFYKYNFSTNSWLAMAQLATKVQGATTFTINGLGYVVGGIDGTGLSRYFYEYHPDAGAGSWAKKRQIINITDSSFDDLYTSIQRQNGVALVIQSPIVDHKQVYLMQGQNGSALNSCWQWDPPTDQWTIQNPYPGNARTGAVAIQLGNRGLFALGGTSQSSSSQYDNMVEFVPGIALNVFDAQ